MEVMPNAPLPRRRPGPRAGINDGSEAEKLHALQLRIADAENSLEVVSYLARMMTRHAAATIRVYGESILQAIEDPDAWLAAIATDKALPLALAIETAQPRTVKRAFTRTISATLSTYIATWSDALGAESARLIGPFATLIVEAATNEALEAERAWLCADWTIRDYPAFWLRHIDRQADAERLLAMAPVQSNEDMEVRANPVLSAIADQVEAELSELASAFPSDPYRASAILDESLSALAVGGADAAFEASAIEAVVAVRVVDAAQSLWVAHVAAASDEEAAAVTQCLEHAADLQTSSLRLLARMIEAGEPKAR
jgi:hypothetical protein